MIISLPAFHSKTSVKPHNLPLTSKLDKKVMTNLDSSKAPGPDCIPLVVLKNCEPQFSYILAELFRKNLVYHISGSSHLWSLGILG